LVVVVGFQGAAGLVEARGEATILFGDGLAGLLQALASLVVGLILQKDPAEDVGGLAAPPGVERLPPRPEQ